MRSDLDHLPIAKRRELERVLAVLFEEFERATAGGTSDYKRHGRITAIVLFGSYARGDWVEDRVSGYRSDYDLLVVVSHDKLVELGCWAAAEERLMRELVIAKRLKTPTNLIVHTATDINEQLKKGRYFFKDLAEQGITLSGQPRFARPGPLSAEEAHAEAQGYFEHWLPLAEHAIRLAKVSIDNGVLRDATFMFHQAAERLYHCLLLVHTLYTPPTHNIKFLRSRAEDLDPRLIAAWPRVQRADRRRFELLKRAYVEARYSKHYKITAEELAWLAECVEHLRALAETSCLERITPLSP